MREGHPALEDWGPESWAEWPHVCVSTTRSVPDYVEKKAQEAGLTRRVTMTASQFMMALPIVQNSDLLLTHYLQCDSTLLSSFGLVQREVPISLSRIPLGLVWASHLDKDASRVWFSNLLDSAFQELCTPRQSAD